jgi:hypothetical protein
LGWVEGDSTVTKQARKWAYNIAPTHTIPQMICWGLLSRLGFLSRAIQHAGVPFKKHKKID